MALEAAVTFSDGITGDNPKKGRADTSAVIEYDHRVYSPIDTQMGSVSGHRVHDAVTFIKPIDKASPLLYECACTGKRIGSVQFDWYWVNPQTGTEDKYFQTLLTNALVASVEHIIPNTKDPSLEKLVHMEKVMLLYEQINWAHIDSNIEFTDSWREPVGA
jgi:type VI secretion system secreted protein Hcp